MAKEIQKTDLFNPTVAQWGSHPDISFADLVGAIRSVHQYSYHEAVKAINRYATMRNWLIGFFIVEYQQKGNDRAAYGEKLLKRLEESLDTRGLNVTLFQNSRLFYALYPQVADLFQINIQPTALVDSDTAMQQAIHRWWNTPLRAWTTRCLSQHTFCNCLTNRSWKTLLGKMKSRRIEK